MVDTDNENFIKKILEETFQTRGDLSTTNEECDLQAYFDCLNRGELVTSEIGCPTSTSIPLSVLLQKAAAELESPLEFEFKHCFPFMMQETTNLYRVLINEVVLDFPRDFYFFKNETDILKVDPEHDPELIFAVFKEIWGEALRSVIVFQKKEQFFLALVTSEEENTQDEK